MLDYKRCCEHFCAKCVKVVEAENVFLTSRNDIHWFCNECDNLATESVLTDRDLDNKLAKYMNRFHEKLVELDSKLKEKVKKKLMIE